MHQLTETVDEFSSTTVITRLYGNPLSGTREIFFLLPKFFPNEIAFDRPAGVNILSNNTRRGDGWMCDYESGYVRG